MKRIDLAEGLSCNLESLLETRMLMQANSGGGKSWALRRLLEQSHGHVQQLVIDPEGEFASLRERYEYVLAARDGGDTAAHPRSAKLLAERLLELGVSAILDIYELAPHDRIRFVRYFLEALVDAPKNLWHPVLVVIDEAHVFAPQVGEAESAAAVMGLATRGRKRGFCAVLATQRLAKLHKDAAAELNNKLIGRSSQDVDMKRAGDELGFGKERLQELRRLPAGHFFAFGPALCDEVRRVQIGGVATAHPKAGAKLAAPTPPPTARIRALLPKLADLPAEADQRARSIESLKQEVRDLKRELAAAKKAQPDVQVERIEVPVIKPAELDQLERIAIASSVALTKTWDGVERLTAALRAVTESIAASRGQRPATVPVAPKRQPPAVQTSAPAPRAARQGGESANPLPNPEQRILDAIAWLEALGVDSPHQPAVAFLANYTSGGGAFNNPRGRLRQLGLVEYVAGDRIRLTESGRAAANAPEGVLTNDELHRRVLGRLPGPEQRVLEPLLRAYPEAMTNEDLARAANYAPNAGSFNNPRGRLRSLGLIEYPQPGMVVALPLLFPESR